MKSNNSREQVVESVRGSCKVPGNEEVAEDLCFPLASAPSTFQRTGKQITKTDKSRIVFQ